MVYSHKTKIYIYISLCKEDFHHFSTTNDQCCFLINLHYDKIQRNFTKKIYDLFKKKFMFSYSIYNTKAFSMCYLLYNCQFFMIFDYFFCVNVKIFVKMFCSVQQSSSPKLISSISSKKLLRFGWSGWS